MALMPQAELCALLKCESTTLVVFLKDHGVDPAQEYDFGRGKMRVYDREQVMPVLGKFDAWRKVRDQLAADRLKPYQRKRGDPSLIHTKLDEINAKLDQILSLWEEK